MEFAKACQPKRNGKINCIEPNQKVKSQEIFETRMCTNTIHIQKEKQQDTARKQGEPVELHGQEVIDTSKFVH